MVPLSHQFHLIRRLISDLPRCMRPLYELQIHSIMYFRDDWPKMPDGSDFDGKQLLTLVRSGNSPFRGVWDVNLLIRD